MWVKRKKSRLSTLTQSNANVAGRDIVCRCATLALTPFVSQGPPCLLCLSVCRPCKGIKHTQVSPDGLIDNNLSTDCVLDLKAPLHFCLDNAVAGTEGGVAAVLLCSVCLRRDQGVLPQDRGGFLELRPERNECHSEPHAGGG